MEIVAGDIGGTKSWLAWLTPMSVAKPQLRFERCYASADFFSADNLLRRFMADAGMTSPPDTLLLALPGALDGQRTKLTNLDWTLDAVALQATLGIGQVHFINDFQAAAAGVVTLTDADMVALNSIQPESTGVRVITGAGTGLGLAFMLADGRGACQSFATEGGHVDFAPANAMQVRLLAQLSEKYGHVSWERVASGSAMHDLYRFCCIEHAQPLPEGLVDGAELGVRAASGDVAAEAALGLFVELYAAWVGNLALLYRPLGGLYIAGGVAAHLIDRITAPDFMAVAANKGRMRGVVERTPVFLITCQRLGLQGAIVNALAQSDYAPSHQAKSNLFNFNPVENRSGT